MPTPLSDPGAALQLYQEVLSGAAIFFAVAAGLGFVLCLVFVLKECLAFGRNSRTTDRALGSGQGEFRDRMEPSDAACAFSGEKASS